MGRGGTVTKRLPKKDVCVCDLLNNSTLVQQWVGFDDSKHPVTHIYKEAGWLYLNDILLITARVQRCSSPGLLEQHLISHEPCAGSG